MEDKDLYRKVSHAARARVEKEFSIGKQLEQVCKQYDSLLERK
jgi:glycosyltransferase involved in cell wall biosynthesis